MDFTEVFNNVADNEFPIPQAVRDLIGHHYDDDDLNPNCTKKTTKGKVVYTVGYNKPGRNISEPPTVVSQHEALLSLFEDIDNDRLTDAESKCVDFFSTIPEVKYDTPCRTPLARAETNIEYCFFSTVDIGTVAIDFNCERLVLLNPSRGTIHRFSTVYNMMTDVYITDKDYDYISMIEEMLDSMNMAEPILTNIDDLPPKYCYYIGFNSYKKFPFNYIGFQPNMLALAGGCVEIFDIENDKFIYNRKERDCTVYLRKHNMVKRADILMYEYSGLPEYNRAQGVFHDLVSSLTIPYSVPIIKSRPIAVNVVGVTLEGDARKVGDTVCIAEQPIVTCKGKVNEHWEKKSEIYDSRYLSTPFHGAVYDIGVFFCADEVISGRSDFLYKGRFYKKNVDGSILFREDDDGVLIDGKKYVIELFIPDINIANFSGSNCSAMEMYSHSFEMTTYEYGEGSMADILGEAEEIDLEVDKINKSFLNG